MSPHLPAARSYLRSTTKAIVALYCFVLGVAFSLVVLNPLWARLVYALGGAYMIVIMAERTLRSRSIRALVHVRKMSPWPVWPMFLFPLSLPWLIGEWGPDRVALTWALLATLALAFINTAGLLMLALE